MRIIIILFSLFACTNCFAQGGWIIQQSGTANQLRSVSTFDGSNTAIVGINGTVLTTNNIGMRWTLQAKPISQNLNGVTFISGGILCAVGPKDSVYRSTNWGVTWKGIGTNIRGECYFIASVRELWAIDYDKIKHICAAVGDGLETIFSEDSGKSWDERSSLTIVSQDFTSQRSVSAINGMVMSVGEREQTIPGSRILTSSDEGDNWVLNRAGVPFYGCNSRTWVSVGKYGYIYHSANKGLSWDFIPSGTTANLNAVSFADEINGFAVGDSGVILVTRDGGYNWLPQVSPTKKNLRSVSMSDPFHGFICGDSGVILYTQNGGFTAGVNAENKVFLNIQNYPNPFPSRTAIHIDLPQTGHITLSIYNMLGVEIAKIADGDVDAGSHSFEWNAADIPSGMYVCRLVADGKSVVSQMIITK